MKRYIKDLIIYILCVPLCPHLFIYYLYKIKHKELSCDLNHYKRRKNIKYNETLCFVYLFIIFPEFRNIFYMRVGKIWRYVLFYLPPLSTLHIWTPSERIGGGLYIGHGWGTVINAEKIGKNCVIGQNCTIGSNKLKELIIEDNVSIWAHCIIIGNITVGSGANIGAGAVIVKDVPNNCVVVPAKSLIIKMDNKRVNIPL